MASSGTNTSSTRESSSQRKSDLSDATFAVGTSAAPAEKITSSPVADSAVAVTQNGSSDNVYVVASP